MKFINSSLSSRELFNLNNSLDEERIIYLLDCEDKLRDLMDAKGCLIDASAQFMSESFGVETLKKLRVIFKTAKGDKRKRILTIIEVLESEISEEFNSSEYGRELIQNFIQNFED